MKIAGPAGKVKGGAFEPPRRDYRTSALKSENSASRPVSFSFFSFKIEPCSQNLGKSAFFWIFDGRAKHRF